MGALNHNVCAALKCISKRGAIEEVYVGPVSLVNDHRRRELMAEIDDRPQDGRGAPHSMVRGSGDDYSAYLKEVR